AAGTGECTGVAGHRAARPGRGLVHAAGGGGSPLPAGFETPDRSLRSARALPSGARQVDRRAHAGRTLKIGLYPQPIVGPRLLSTGLCLRSTFLMPYSGESSHIAPLRG